VHHSRKENLLSLQKEQYPQHIMIEFTQDKCDLLNNYGVGEPVKVSINIRKNGKSKGKQNTSIVYKAGE
jgi:hypothetical protein